VIEVMPIASFAGERGWGYDGVGWLAPHRAYGAPADVVAFVDAAHAAGLSVILDVVLNHLGPAGNYLPQLDPDLFDPSIDTPWGPAPSYAHPAMRALAREVVRQWVVEYGFDGLRLDATHAIVDRSPRHLLAELAELAASLPGPPVLIAEDERNDPSLITEVGLDGVWADDFHHALHVLLTGEQDGYYASFAPGLGTVAETIRRGWLFEGQVAAATGKPRGRPLGDLGRGRLVVGLENHDQVGNRALGERLAQLAGDAAARAATLVLAFSPTSVLLFQGQEWGASTPFLYFTDHAPELGRMITEGRRRELGAFAAFAGSGAEIPDPQDRETFRRSQLAWSEREQAPHAAMLALHCAALALRKSDPVLSSPRSTIDATVEGDRLAVVRSAGGARRTLVWNRGREPIAVAGEVLLVSSPAALARGELAPEGAAILAG
jgi:maltooligosyltrehalose trehalohydrolase